MNMRRVKIVLLCEDSQQEAFTRRFLEGMGWNTRELRVEKSPSARGSAEQWVREEFVNELKIYRQRRHKAASGLIVMVDADVKEVQDRINEFRQACTGKGISFRKGDEAVAIAVPKRNIETWICYLKEEQVCETDAYPRLKKERLCQPAAGNLVRLCKSTGLPENAPLSLIAACLEYKDRIKPLS